MEGPPAVVDFTWKSALLKSFAVFYVFISIGVILYLIFVPQKVTVNSGDAIVFTPKSTVGLPKSWQQLEKMPETTPAQIALKLEKTEKMLGEYASPEIRSGWAIKQRLGRICSSQLAWNKWQRQCHSDEDCLASWFLGIVLLQCDKIERTLEVEKKLAEQENDVLGFLTAQRGELSQLSHEKRIREIITRVTPRTLKRIGVFFRQLPVSTEIKKAWNSLILAYENLPEPEEQMKKQPFRYVHQLELYNQRFLKYLPRFVELMQQRQYQKAQNELEHFWQGLNSMEDIDAQSPLLIKLRQKLKETQSVKALFSIANEGAKNYVGLPRELTSRTGEVFAGKIEKYALGVFYVRSEQKHLQKIALRDLRAKEIVLFALSTKKKQYFAYQYAGIFYFYEQEYSFARQVFLSALQHGANPAEIQDYLKQLPQAAPKRR